MQLSVRGNCVGGPLDRKPMQGVTGISHTQVIELDDQSLHVYEFESTSMSDGAWHYLGVVFKPGEGLQERASEVLGDEVVALIVQFTEAEVKKQFAEMQKKTVALDVLYPPNQVDGCPDFESFGVKQGDSLAEGEDAALTG